MKNFILLLFISIFPFLVMSKGGSDYELKANKKIIFSPGLGVESNDNFSLKNEKEVRFEDAVGSYNGFKSPSLLSGDITFELPDGDGTSNQVLSTNGSAVLGWLTPLLLTPANDNRVVRTDLAGNTVQESGIVVDDSDNVTGINNLTANKLSAVSTSDASHPCPSMDETARDLLTPASGDCVDNTTSGQYERYDGVDWNAIAGGGAGDISNLLTDGGFELTVATTENGLTCTTGTCAASTTRAFGEQSLSISLTAQAADVVKCYDNTLAQWDGKLIELSAYIKTSADTVEACYWDGASEGNCVNVNDQDTWSQYKIIENVGTENSLCIKFKSASETDIILVDNAFIGDLKLSSGLDAEVSFSAMAISSTPTITSTAQTIVILDQDDGATLATFDRGNNYDTTTGIFTAPSDGRYLFTFEGLPGNATPSELFQIFIKNTVSGKVYGRTLRQIDSSGRGLKAVGLADLVKGDTVAPYSRSTADTNYNYQGGGGTTAFYGHKLPSDSSSKFISNLTPEQRENDFSAFVDSTGAIQTENVSGWLDPSTSKTGTGIYDVNFKPGLFAAIPSCTMTGTSGGRDCFANGSVQTDDVLVHCRARDGGGAFLDSGFGIHCSRQDADYTKTNNVVGTFRPAVNASKRSTNAGNIIATSTFTYIDFDDQEFDEDGNFSGCGSGNVTTHNTGCKYVVPSDGKYRINSKLTFQTTQLEATEQYNIYIRVNNVARSEGLQQSRFTNANSKYWEVPTDTILDLSEGDIVEIVFLHDTGTNQTPLSDGLANIWEVEKVDQAGVINQSPFHKELTVTLDNNFNNGVLHIQRVGSVVTVYADGLSHGVLSFAESTAGLIPSWARPTSGLATNVIYNHPSAGWQIAYGVETDGTFREWTINEAGAPLGSSGIDGGSVTYSIK